ncbi:MAG: histidine--tRNA ligase [Candidatus Beckwithbacteria bacterium]|nr:histidine--tRNA ligase [Candidatus Beckwithbacteria bacterium]
MSKNLIKPRTLKGFRDFLPAEKRKRDFVMGKIKQTFELFGFEPLETPTLEYASVLQGKYGKEADKLIYTFTDRGGRELGLRYDQSVPTARFLAQYQGQLPQYFRRYQIQNVFRADKPQSGRYREFAQCDADIYGSDSYLADAEILAVYYAIYANLAVPKVVIKYNDRVTLIDNLRPFATKTVDVFSLIQSIDKLDKLSQEEVINELEQKGLRQNTAKQAIDAAKQTQPSANLKQIIAAAKTLGVPQDSLEFSPILARGLDYYTGLIFEGFIPDYASGSVGGGGRYDNLIKQLCGIQIPAVGFGLGFDRTVEAITQLNLLPQELTGAKVLAAVFDNPQPALKAAAALRQKNISVEVFPATEKIDKQLKYANKKGIPYVLMIGPDEAGKNVVTLKDMTTGKQESLTLDQAIDVLTR